MIIFSLGAASSIASAIPSSLLQISATAGALSFATTKPLTAAPRVPRTTAPRYSSRPRPP